MRYIPQAPSTNHLARVSETMVPKMSDISRGKGLTTGRVKGLRKQ